MKLKLAKLLRSIADRLAPEWHAVSVEFTPPIGSTSARPSVTCTDTAGANFVTPLPKPQFIADPRFESGRTRWRLDGQ